MIKISQLFERYYNKTASISERKKLMEEIARGRKTKELILLEKKAWDKLDINEHFYTEAESARLFSQVLTDKEKNIDTSSIVDRIHFLKTVWLRYAAAVLLVFGVSTYIYLNNKPEKGIVKNNTLQQHDILPGSDKAILTLADGQQIKLDSSANNLLAESGVKNNNSSISYTAVSSVSNGTHTLTTPKGGQYKLELSDGTRVWLNSASSITYPAVFTGNERTISLTGEVYFEVFKDKSRPFIVTAEKEQIKVLGTKFNINAYSNESGIKTSLLEGSVSIANTVLKPGEAFINGSVTKTDITQDIAWKNNLFNFDNKRLEEVMRQLERWYDIEVHYATKPPKIKFTGEMYRNINLSDVLEGLNKMGVKFKLEGKILTVL